MFVVYRGLTMYNCDFLNGINSQTKVLTFDIFSHDELIGGKILNGNMRWYNKVTKSFNYKILFYVIFKSKVTLKNNLSVIF